MFKQRLNIVIQILILSTILLMLLTACSYSTLEEIAENNDIIFFEVESDEFKLSVAIPKEVFINEEISLNGWITYTGSKNRVTLYHGSNLINFNVMDSENERMNPEFSFLNLMKTKMKKHQQIDHSFTFKFTQAGTYQIIVRTSLLMLDDTFIVGVGNETYLDDGMEERMKQVENSKLTLTPITIQVK